MSNTSDARRLFAQYAAGKINEEGLSELEAALVEDADLRSDFIEYLNVDSALSDLASLPDAEFEAIQATDFSRNVPQQIESRTLLLPFDAERSKLSLSKVPPWWIATAAVAALIALCVLLPGQPDTSHGDVVATVQNARKVQEFSAGDQLRSGQIMKLVNGYVKINFQSGAKLAIQAPAELTLLGSNSAQLQHGVATVRVPGEIKGFVLVTPHQRVTDLGTSFGLDVATTGDTSISVFEGEIELEDHRRLVGGQTVALTANEELPREIPYAISQFLDTWQVSFGVERLVGDVRVAAPNERHSPGRARDSDSLLLFPEREDTLLEQGFVVDAVEPGTYRRPFRKHTVKLTKNVRVDSFLLQYNPGHSEALSRNQSFQGELHFDRPIVALILQKDLLDSSDARLALPDTDFSNVFRRGINDADVVALSSDRRVLRVDLNIKNGVDQIRVLVATDDNLETQ
ncbi:MAG: FecR domain-containing protein [Planctomycetes bacterium]|nr:FecR domain-containing protein [Planctomycetota bacterium]